MLSRFLIIIPSSFNLSTERAIAIFIANGSPSGIATIKITTAVIAILLTLSKVSFEIRPSYLLNI